MYEIESMTLTNTSAGHNKFYQLVFIEKKDKSAVLLTRWGIIGSAGQCSAQTGSASRMRAEHTKTVKEKIRKGYHADATATQRHRVQNFHEFISLSDFAPFARNAHKFQDFFLDSATATFKTPEQLKADEEDALAADAAAAKRRQDFYSGNAMHGMF